VRGVLRFTGFLGLLLVVPACGREETSIEIDETAAWKTLDPGMTPGDLAAKLPLLDTVPIDPPPDVGKDYHPTFPDPIPFEPSEWLRNEPPRSVAVPGARKAGTLRLATPEWPATIRTDGPNSRLSFLSTIHNFVYETLLGYDSNLKDYVPALATHWQVLPDKATFRFRLDPEARWADGRPVTADDVAATLDHYRNPDRKDPAVSRRWTEIIERVTILDRLTVEVKCREPRWRTFLSLAAGLLIYPAAYIRMDGDTYINDWNWKLPPGSGPYELRPDGIRKGRSISLKRRKGWWAREKPWHRGMYNFDTIKWIIVRDPELEYTKFLAGELDVYRITRAQRWVEELDGVEKIRNGWIQRRRIFNLDPEGYGGFCMNMRRPPFDDRNVRLGFAHLFNREKLMSSFFFYQYEYMDSYFPGMEFARPNPERIRYDPKRARELLAESGWVAKDDEGYLIDAKGQRFPTINFEYSGSSYQRIYDVIRNDLWDEAGIELKMKLVNDTALSKKMWEYKFDLFHISWTGSHFPSPEFSWKSDYADVPRTNNLPGFKNEEVDRIIEAYKFEFDGDRRMQMLRRLDEILFDAHPYALSWYGPYFRILYWDKFGHPPEYASRFTAHIRNVMAFWWFDPEMKARLEENVRGKISSYPGRKNGQYDEIDQKYWLTHTHPMEDE